MSNPNELPDALNITLENSSQYPVKLPKGARLLIEDPLGNKKWLETKADCLVCLRPYEDVAVRFRESSCPVGSFPKETVYKTLEEGA